MGKEFVEENRRRQERMNKLYAESGRDQKDHPMAGLLTGLYEEHLRKEKAKAAFPFIAR